MSTRSGRRYRYELKTGFLKYCLLFLMVPAVAGTGRSAINSKTVPDHIVSDLADIGEQILMSRRNGNLSDLAFGHYHLADYYARNQQWSVAGRLLRQTITEANFLHDQFLMAKLLMLSAKVDFLTGKAEGAEKTLSMLIDFGKKSNDDVGQARAMMELASIYQREGKGNDAWPLLRSAVKLAAGSGMMWEQASILHQMGIISRDLGDIAPAAGSFTEAALLFGKAGDRKSEALVYTTLCGILIDAGLEQAATGYATEAIKLYKGLSPTSHHSRMLAYAYNTLGMACSHAHKIKEAREAFMYAFNTWAGIGDVKNQVFAADNLANLALGEKNINEAGGFLQTAFSLNGALINDIPSAVILHTRSRYLDAIGRSDSAAIVCRQAVGRFLRVGVVSLAVEALDDLMNYEKRNGNLAAALEAAGQWRTLSDSVNKGLTSATVASLQIEYDARLGKETIRNLNREMELKEANLQRTKFYLFVFVAATMAILVLLLMLGLQIRNRNQAYSALLEKNLQIMQLNTPRASSLPQEGSGSAGNVKESSEQLKSINDLEGIIQRLMEAIEIRKVYRDAGLTLPGLAQMLGTNTSYLSRIINEEHNTNFNAYINNFRIREACELIQEGEAERLTLEALGNRVGFSSRASFHAAFKKITGLTPGIYTEQIKNRGLIINKV